MQSETILSKWSKKVSPMLHLQCALCESCPGQNRVGCLGVKSSHQVQLPITIIQLPLGKIGAKITPFTGQLSAPWPLNPRVFEILKPRNSR